MGAGRKVALLLGLQPRFTHNSNIKHRYLSAIPFLNPAVYISYRVKWKNIDWEAGGRLELQLGVSYLDRLGQLNQPHRNDANHAYSLGLSKELGSRCKLNPTCRG